MILKLSLDLPDDAAYVTLTRQFGRGLLEYLNVIRNVIREDIADVETIVTEPVSNVIRHAKSSDGRFQMLLEYYADHILITIVDAGQGFTFRDVAEVGSPRADLEGGERLGGFGLPLQDALSDRLEFSRTDPQGTTACAEKRLRYEAQGDADDAQDINEEGGGQISVSGG